MKLNKKSIFQNFISLTFDLNYGPLNSATHIFTRLEGSSPFPTADELPGSVVQTKSRTTYLLILS